MEELPGYCLCAPVCPHLYIKYDMTSTNDNTEYEM